MLEMLVFDMDSKELQNIFNNYEIFNLKSQNPV